MAFDIDYWRREYEHQVQETWRERNLATQAMRERDEARGVARELFGMSTEYEEDHQLVLRLEKQYSWLNDEE